MRVTTIPLMVASGVLLVASGFAAADGTRPTAFERYGIGGHIQPIGLHHGFHIQAVAPGSDASRDQLMPHDIIVKVDGDVIRSLDHLRAVLAEAYLNEAEVTLTYTRGGSIVHHVVKSRLGQADVKALAKKRRLEPEGTR
jgi:S1-C subfamily serine protease